MPGALKLWEGQGAAAEQIITTTSDSDFIDQTIRVLEVIDRNISKRKPAVIQALSKYTDERGASIEKVGLTKHEGFLSSVNQLLTVREGTVVLTAESLSLNQAIQASSENLADRKQALVNKRGVRQNITDVSDGLKESLKILSAVNHAFDLIRNRKYYGALKAVEDLQNEYLVPTIQNKYATQYRLADLIQKHIPALQKTISDAVMSDLNTWLFRIRETSQFLGEVSFYHTEQRRERQRKRVEQNEFLSHFKLNSAVELVSDEDTEYDVLDNEEVSVDFTPLFEALHIHESLGQSEKFRSEYASTRRQQKELLMPNSVALATDDEESGLSALLEDVAGFAIIEKATQRRAPQLYSSVDVDELWESMCNTSITLISRALDDITNAEVLLKIKGHIALFIQTMEAWGYSVSILNKFQLILFHKYAELLKRRFSEDFQEIVSTDDYMPMAINSIEEYEKVLNVSWFTSDTPIEEINFPCVLPFSQMYPLCCIDIRNFLNQFYFFSDDHFQHSNIIDETLRKSLDELLSEKVCKSLVERLNSQYLGQIVQILINLEHFENACQELEQLLIRARSSSSAGGPVTLESTEQFRSNKKTAEKRIFELVNSKIDDLIDTSEYEWMATTPPADASNYMVELTRFLSNNMTSTLLGLPREIKELIYFDALSHAADKILALPLSPDVKKINPNGVLAMAKDVQYLTQFVAGLDNSFMLQQNIEELQQTIALLQSDNHDEFFDITTRNKKYGRVDAVKGPLLLEKLTHTIETGRIVPAPLANFGSRFGLNRT